MTTPEIQGALGKNETPVPGIGEAENKFISDVLGNKEDAADAVVGTTASIVSYIKGLLGIVGGAPLNEIAIALGPFGNPEVSDVDSAVRYAVYLYSLGTGAILTNAQTTEGSFTVTRVRAGVPTVLVGVTPSTESNGVISAVVDFTTGPNDWVEDDVGFIEFSGIVATISGTITNFPVLRRSFRVVGTGIESSLTTIDALHDVPAPDAVTNAQMRDVIGNKSDALSTAINATNSIVRMVKGILSRVDVLLSSRSSQASVDVIDAFHDVPVVDSTDNTQMRDVIGNKGDTRSTVLTTDKSLMAYIKGVTNLSVLATGTFTNSSATVPADTGRTEADGYFDGSWIIPLTGAVTLQPRLIAAFANTGGVFTLDSEHPFTAAPGLVEYVIVGATNGLVPAVDSAANQTIDHVIGNKSDTIAGNSVIALLKQVIAAAVDHTVPAIDAVANLLSKEVIGNKADAAQTTVGTTRSIMAYVKGLLSRVDVLLSSRSTQASVDVIDAFHDVPAVDAVANAQMRDAVGNKADSPDLAVVATNSLMAYLKGLANVSALASGTFTTSSATVPADTSRTEADGYWDGSWLIPLAGAVAFQPRQITAFANTGGIFTLDSEHPFTAAPGLVDYVIVGAGGNIVPSADSTANQTEAHVLGNKTDAAVTAVSAVASAIAYLKGILESGVLASGTFTTSSATVPADSGRTEGDDFFKGSHLIPLSGAIAFQPRQIVAYTGAGGIFTLDSELPFTAAPGLVDYVVVGSGSNLVPAVDSTANQTIAHAVGNKADAAVTTVGVVASIVGYIKGILGFHDVPAVDSTDNNQMRDVIGNKGDTRSTTLASDKSLMAYIKGVTNLSVLATGTFTTSSATVPADTGRTEADGYFDGSWLIPLVGAVALQPRLVASFANAGGVFILDSEHPFTAAPGLIEYVIVGASNGLVPAADSAANQLTDHVVGNKADAAVTTVGVVASVIAYLKGVLNRIGTPAGASVSADILVVKSLVDSAETVGPFTLLDNALEQTIEEDIALVTRRHVSIEFDLSALTQDGTIRIYRKVDGTNFQLWITTAFSAAGSEKVFDSIFTTNQNWQLTYQADIAEGATRSIPFNTITEVIE